MKKTIVFLVLATLAAAACGGGSATPTEDSGELKGAGPAPRPSINASVGGGIPTINIPVGKSTPNMADPWDPGDNTMTIIGLGDSFGSGEGNPFTPGATPNGLVGVQEVWAGSPGAGLAPSGDERCHRSDRSGVAKAAAAFKTQNPSWNVIYKSFACSGAVSANIDTQRYKGTDMKYFNQPLLAPQLEQAATWAGKKRVDVVYVSIGGNDAGFGDVVTECFIIPGECRNSATVKNYENALPNSITIPIQRVAGAIRSKFPKAAIIFSAYPDLLSVQANTPADDDDNGICSRFDFPLANLLPGGAGFDLIWNIRTEDAFYLRDTFQPKLNNAIKAAVADMNTRPEGRGIFYIEDHYVDQSGRNGFCSPTPIVNSNGVAMLSQGCDPDLISFPVPSASFTILGTTISTPAFTVGACAISKGAWHPNNAGYELYGKAILNGILKADVRIANPTLSSRWRAAPASTDAVWPRSVSSNGQITVEWNDLSTNEDYFRVSYTTSGTTSSVTSSATTATFTGAPNTAYVVSVKACHTHAPNGQEVCSTGPTPSTLVSTSRPTTPVTGIACSADSTFGRIPGGCEILFQPPAGYLVSSATYLAVQISRDGQVVGGATFDSLGGTVLMQPTTNDKVGTQVTMNAVVQLCSIVDGGVCVPSALTPVTMTVTKDDGRNKPLRVPPALTRPLINIPMPPGVKDPSIGIPGLQGGIQRP